MVLICAIAIVLSSPSLRCWDTFPMFLPHSQFLLLSVILYLFDEFLFSFLSIFYFFSRSHLHLRLLPSLLRYFKFYILLS